MADCHRRISKAACKSRSGFNNAGWRHHSASCSLNRNPKSSKTTVVYLVRSLGLMPEFVSHDWHVQPSCQRPNRGPPRRREFSPGGFFFVSKPTSANPTVLETLQTYRAAQNPVNRYVPQDFQMISTSGIRGAGAGELPAKPKSRFLTIKLFGMTKPFGRFGLGARIRATVCAFRSE